MINMKESSISTYNFPQYEQFIKSHGWTIEYYNYEKNNCNNGRILIKYDENNGFTYCCEYDWKILDTDIIKLKMLLYEDNIFIYMHN